MAKIIIKSEAEKRLEEALEKRGIKSKAKEKGKGKKK